MKLVFALVWLWCGSVHAGDVVRVQVASPQSGAVLRSGVIPVLVRLPVTMRFHTGALFLDGQPLSNVPTVVRRRWWEGKGADLIASLPSADVSAGWHTLRVELYAPTDPSLIRPDVDQNDHEIERRFRFAPRPVRLEATFVNQLGQPRSGRLDVFDSEGNRVAIGNKQDANADPSLRDIPRTGLFVGEDGAVEFLKPGRYSLLASGGVRDGVVQRDVTVYSGTTRLRFSVPELFDTPSEWSADLHVHTGMSSDAFVADTERFEALAAAGIDVAVITEHNRVRAPVSALDMLNMASDITVVTGAEIRIGPAKGSIGHVNAFPMSVKHPVPVLGDASPAEGLGVLRRHHVATMDTTHPFLIQLNHPRGIQFQPGKRFRTDAHALFEELNFLPSLPVDMQSDPRARAVDPISGSSILDFDAIEVLNRFSLESWRRVRKDWFALMNQGVQVTGTGNADSHTAQLERMGFPMNLVQKGDGSIGGFLRSIDNGEVRVSSGPLVDLTVSGVRVEAKPSHTLVPVDGAMTATIRVRAAPWVPVHAVRLVQDGEVIFRKAIDDLGPERDREWVVPIVLTSDSWVLAEAGWTLDNAEPPGGTYADVAPGHYPIGFTNPVWLDWDGDGVWQPTVAPGDRALQ